MTVRRSDRAIRRSSAFIATAPTVLFIHGFLDDATGWDDLIEAMGDTVASVRYDLPGFGARHDQAVLPHDLSLQSLAAEAADILTSLDTRVVVVGHSLGAQVAELVAAEHPDHVDGLVLITPVPLAGTRLPEDVIAPFRGLAADAEAQRTARAQLSPALSTEQLDRLTRIGTRARPEIAARYADIWNDGLDSAPVNSAYTGLVLIIGGSSDSFITKELIDTIARRFTWPDIRTIDHAGHWLHVEYPGTTATLILDFLDEVTEHRHPDDSHHDLAPASHDPFAGGFSDDVVLEGSVFAKPVAGRSQVQATLAAAASIYESLQFTAAAHTTTTSYLEWTARTFGGVETKGVSVVQRNTTGAVIAVALHHRPLPAVLRFSAALRERLANIVAAEHFLVTEPSAPG